jgi:hypothetical protein
MNTASYRFRVHGLQLVGGGTLVALLAWACLRMGAATPASLQAVLPAVGVLLGAIALYMLIGGAVLLITADRGSRKPSRPFWPSFPPAP